LCLWALLKVQNIKVFLQEAKDTPITKLSSKPDEKSARLFPGSHNTSARPAGEGDSWLHSGKAIQL
jgi:hypothetical protein